MKWLLIPIFIFSNSIVIDFGESKTNSWYSVNDTVMGGRSSGTTIYQEDVVKFQGSISFQNNGGFASIRSRFSNMDLSDFDEVEIRYRSKGQSLNFTLEHHGQWYLPNYKVVLPESGVDWTTRTYSLKSFKEYRVGRPTGGMISDEVLQRILRFSIMTNDKREGPFQAEIDYIRFN